MGVPFSVDHWVLVMKNLLSDNKIHYPYYVYLHVNGTLTHKTAIVVEINTTPDEYFDSPMVKKWWKICNSDDFHKMIEEMRNDKLHS